jgi:hypothetical protein
MLRRRRVWPYVIKVDCVWNVKAHAQKPDFVFQRNGRVHLNRRGRQFSRLLAAEMCASAVVLLDIPCSEVVWRVLATHSIHQFPLHFPSLVSPCAITFQLDSTFVIYVRRSGCLSVCSSVRMNQRGFHWADFRQNSYWALLQKSVEEIQI